MLPPRCTVSEVNTESFRMVTLFLKIKLAISGHGFMLIFILLNEEKGKKTEKLGEMTTEDLIPDLLIHHP